MDKDRLFCESSINTRRFAHLHLEHHLHAEFDLQPNQTKAKHWSFAKLEVFQVYYMQMCLDIVFRSYMGWYCCRLIYHNCLRNIRTLVELKFQHGPKQCSQYVCAWNDIRITLKQFRSFFIGINHHYLCSEIFSKSLEHNSDTSWVNLIQTDPSISQSVKTLTPRRPYRCWNVTPISVIHDVKRSNKAKPYNAVNWISAPKTEQIGFIPIRTLDPDC